MPNLEFDCTNTVKPVCTTNNNNNFFHYICLGSKREKSNSQTFYTLEDIIDLHNLNKKHIFLQIDCEGGEYTGLKYFPTEKLKYIDQIVAEIHFDQIYPEEWGVLDIFKSLMREFVSVNYHMNNYSCLKRSYRKLGSNAFEVTLVNKRLIKLNSQSRSFKLNSFNRPNAPDLPDCQVEE